MIPNKAKELATNMLLSAYGKDEADIKFINTAVQTIFEGEDVNEATQI